jgi:hypothetical protein
MKSDEIREKAAAESRDKRAERKQKTEDIKRANTRKHMKESR